MKKLNNKGFTLIEIVIVIVIIAILAAMLVPSLTSWIDNANKKTFLEAANTLKTSTLSQLTENYAVGKTTLDKSTIEGLANCSINTIATGSSAAKTTAANIYNVAYTMDSTNSNVVATFTVTNSKYTVTFDNSTGAWGDVDDAPATAT